jgi:hypothetical protein
LELSLKKKDFSFHHPLHKSDPLSGAEMAPPNKSILDLAAFQNVFIEA